MTLAKPRDQVPDARWSVSLVEASKAQAKRREEEERFRRWNTGNHDSTNFFRKMGQSLADTERYKAQCRSAALASPSRNAEEKVSLESTTRYVDVAKAFADFSNVCILPSAEGASVNLDGTVDAPRGLLHLKDASAAEMRLQMEEAATKVQAVARGRSSRKQVTSEGSGSRHESSREEHQVSQHSVSEHELLGPEESQPEMCRDHSATSDGDDYAFGEDELSPVTPAITIVQPGIGSNAPSVEAASRRTSRRSSEDSSAEDENAVVGDDWPPKPPIVRFRAQMVFSKQFQGDVQKEKRRASLEKADELKRLQGSDEVIEDITLTWINMYFKLHIQTDRQLSAAFPLVILSMMDVIYPKKVRWHQVNWNTSYQRALHQNHRVLEKIWFEVNMDKVKDLRSDQIGAIEKMLHASAFEKLAFLKQVKRWFDCRVLHSNAFDPIKRRTEIEKQIRVCGRWMKFPAWMEFDKEEIQANRSKKPSKNHDETGAAPTDFEKMPEFKRLLWFLGSAEHQTM